MKQVIGTRHLLVLALTTALTGCQLGPGRLQSASSHYSDALRVAGSEQLLVNLVRLRYRDIPVFLGVSSISTQFEFDSALDVNGSVVSGGSDGVGIGTSLRYAERPTFTFEVQGGEEFQKRLLRPLSVAAISLVAESGWRGDRLLRLTAESLNGVPNAPTASGPTPGGAPEYGDFLEATAILRRLTSARLLDFEYETRRKRYSAPLPISQIDGRHAVEAIKAGVEFEALETGEVQLVSKKRVLLMRLRERAEGSPDVIRLRQLLRLDPKEDRFEIVALEDSTLDPFDAEQRVGQLAIDTRSMLGVFYYAANGVRIPNADLESGRATSTLDGNGDPFDWSQVLGELLDVRSADQLRCPDNAAVAVRHRGHWFYIADDDENSKSTFTLLSQLYQLQASDVKATKPVLTLPVGGGR